MDIIHHSLPINLETNGSTHRASIQNFQKSPKMKNEIIILVINYRRFFPLSYFIRQKFSNILNTTQILKRGIFLSFPYLIE